MLIILSFPVRLSRAYNSQWEKQMDLTGRVGFTANLLWLLLFFNLHYFSLVFALHVTRES